MQLRLTMMALAGAGSLAFAIPGFAASGNWSKDFKVSGRAELRVEVDDGRVTLTGSEGKQIEARVMVTGWNMGPDGVQVYDRQTGDRVELDVRVAKMNRWFSFGDRSVRVEVRVPNGLLANVHTRDGAIIVDGVRGSLRLRTGDGHVEATGIDGTLDADTGDGSIRLRGRLDGMSLHTGDGSIEAELPQWLAKIGPKDQLIVYFSGHGFRDAAGHEVDLLIPDGGRLHPVEIKSGQTIAADFFHSLSKWRELAGRSEAPAWYSTGVRCGDGSHSGSASTRYCLPWCTMRRTRCTALALSMERPFSDSSQLLSAVAVTRAD